MFSSDLLAEDSTLALPSVRHHEVFLNFTEVNQEYLLPEVL